MSNITATVRSTGTATIVGASTPTIYNVSAPTAGTEYSQTLSTNVKKFTIRCRDNAKTQLAFESGESGTNYITIRPGTVYSEESLGFTGVLYFQTNKNTQTIEIWEWV